MLLVPRASRVKGNNPNRVIFRTLYTMRRCALALTRDSTRRGAGQRSAAEAEAEEQGGHIRDGRGRGGGAAHQLEIGGGRERRAKGAAETSPLDARSLSSSSSDSVHTTQPNMLCLYRSVCACVPWLLGWFYVFYAPKAHGTGRCALGIHWITVNCWDYICVLCSLPLDRLLGRQFPCPRCTRFRFEYSCSPARRSQL